jgi:putative transcriptional regulator
VKNRVRQLRQGLGWTQEDLGREVGVSRQAIIAIETERHAPSVDLAFRIAALFGKRVEDVFENPYR